MDIHSKKIRSYNMSRIRSKNSKPEIILRKYLFSEGYRYRINVKSLPGSPDIILKKYKTAIFVHGCFWHMHEGCNYFKYPATNPTWWKNKLIKNKERDKRKINELHANGWNVIVVWECEIKNHSIFLGNKINNLINLNK